MKKRFLCLFLALTSSLLLLASSNFVKATDYDKKNEELRDKANQNNAQIEEKQNEIDKKNSEINSAQEKIEETSQKIADISQKIADAETQLSKLEKELKESEIRLEEFKQKEITTREEMKLRIQYMYENSNTNLLVLFFEKGSLADFLNSTEYHSQITAYDRQKLDEYIKIKEAIEQETNTQKKLIAEQEQIKAQLELDRENSRQLIKEQEELIASNKVDIDNMSEDIQKLQDEIEAAEREIQENIRKALEQNANRGNSGISSAPSNVSNNVPASSGYIWPLPSNYTNITSPFSADRRLVFGDYVLSGHRGVDIGAPIGTPIYAARAGVVVYSGYLYSTGNVVCILQDDGRVSRYMHMSVIGVGTGQYVSQGETIGQVGNTGLSTGPHLHFQVEHEATTQWGATAFDPLTLY